MSRSERADPPHIASQVSAAWASLDAAARESNLQEALTSQDRNFASALGEMERVKDAIGSPQHILGNLDTKHGEIAEEVHVAFRRAADALQGKALSCSFDGVPRTGPVDYWDNGQEIQSKYYNGLRNTLDGVLEHAKAYPEHSSGGLGYHIPRDQSEQLQQLNQTGQVEGLSEKSARAVAAKLQAIADQTGREPNDLIAPGEANYSEVQQGRVHHSIENREQQLAQENGRIKDDLRQLHAPSLGGALKAAGMGAAAGAGVGIGQALWVKHRQGKSLFRGDLNSDDWKEIFGVGAKSAAKGGIAGAALYALTNSTDLAAPFAGSLVSTLMGIGELLRQRAVGDIDAEQFAAMSHCLAADAAIVAVASAAGQAVVPIPVLGAMVGSLAGKLVASALKGQLTDASAELDARLASYEYRAMQELNSECRALFERLDAHFSDLKMLASLAFDEKLNTEIRLQSSVRYAEAVGVPLSQILRTTDDVDAFMME